MMLSRRGDDAGNVSLVQTEFTPSIQEASVVSSNIGTGVLVIVRLCILTATDNLDTNPDIYYTMDGYTQTTTSTLYSGPIIIDTNYCVEVLCVVRCW